MFKLVQFLGDDVYYVCCTKDVKQNSAKWNNKYYAVKVIATSNNKSMLDDLCHNINKCAPFVPLCRISYCSDISSADIDKTVEPQTFIDYGIQETCGNNNLEPTQQELDSLQYIVSNNDFVSGPIGETVIFGSNEELSKSPASTSSDGDCLPPDSYQLEVALSLPGCSFSEPVSSGGADVNIEPDINLDFDENDDDSVKDQLYNPEEDSEDDESDEQLDDDIEIDNLQHTVLDQTLIGEMHNNSTGTRDTRKVTRDRRPHPEELNEECEKIGNTSHEIYINRVPKSNEKCKKYFCIYCKKLICKFARHLEVKHKNIQEVIELSLLPKGCSERKSMLEAIRNKGTFIHNVSQFNTGVLIVSRRPTKDHDRAPQHYKVCPSCKGFYSKTTIRRHFVKCDPQCISNDKSLSVQSNIVHGRVHHKATSVLKNQIFPRLRDDMVTNVIRYDELAILFGNKLTEKYRKPHLHKMIRSKLRLIGRIMLAVKNINPSITNFASMLTPSNYDDIIEAVNDVAVYNPDIQKYKSPATAFEYGTLLKKCAKLLKNQYIKKDDEEGVKKTNNFLSILEEDYTSSINKTVEENQLDKKRHKKIILPLQEDIHKLNEFLRIERQKYLHVLHKGFDMYAWNKLAMCTLTSIQIFNRRRSGEMERLTVEDFEAYESVHPKDLQMYKSLSSEDRESAQKYVRFVIRGKRGRPVPVLLHDELLKCVETIVKYRREAGVPISNVYVFGLPGSNEEKHLDSCSLLRTFSAQCGAKVPLALRGTELRKQFATTIPILNDFKDSEVDDIANFMGHARKIHDEHYKIPLATRDIVRMSRLLEKGCGENANIDGQLESSTGIDTVEKEISIEYNSEDNYENAEYHSNSENESTQVITSMKKKKRSVSPVGYVKRTSWSDEEKTFVLEKFKENITNETLPSTEYLAQVINTTHVLQHRNEVQLKSWISNQIQKKRHQIPGGSRRNKGPVIYWTKPETDTLKRVFAKNLSIKKLPSLAECDDAIKKYPELHLRSREKVKAWINNQLRK